LRGVWIFELAEIPHLRKEMDRTKAFISRQVDRFRRPYDRATSDQPRQCIFIGSTNDLEFTDPTGNRRFLPVPLKGLVEVDAIMRDRDQLWAESLHLYRQGEPSWLSSEMEKIAAKLQSAYAEEDSWIELVDEWLEQQPLGKDGTIAPFTVREILESWGYAFRPGKRSTLGITPGNPIIATKSDEMRVARCLTRLGFRRDPHRHRDTGRAIYWIPVKS
jgi:hypothetical protein